MLTLHGYFGRELAKTFALTAAALTVLVVMGGGVANLFRGEGVAARDLVKIFLYLTPVAVTMILPVAALFSAAITYGRASADNEILACRAAGINVHRVLAAAAALGLLVTSATYFAWNHLIPTLSERLEALSRRDLPSIVMGQFQLNKALRFGNYVMVAERFKTVPPEELGLESDGKHTYVLLRGVSFIEMEDELVSRCGTAEATVVDFDQSGEFPQVRVDLQGVSTFDVPRRQYFEWDHQILGPRTIPLRLMRWRLKFQDLRTLTDYNADPRLIPEISDRFRRLKRNIMEQFVYQQVAECVRSGAPFPLAGPDGAKYAITAEKCMQLPSDLSPRLTGVTVVETRGSDVRTYRAGVATVELKNLEKPVEEPDIVVELLEGVQITFGPDGRGGRTVSKPRETLAPAAFDDQPEPASRLAAFDLESLFDPAAEFPWMPPKVQDAHIKLLERLAEFQSEVRGEIHFRASYAASALAIILLGAMLGVVFRGGQVLTAFGISCVPTAIVVVAGIVGRNLAERPDLTTVSLTVMWGSTAFVFLAAVFVGLRVLQR